MYWKIAVTDLSRQTVLTKAKLYQTLIVMIEYECLITQNFEYSLPDMI